MKKRLSLLLVIVMTALLVFGLAGCGNKTTTEAPKVDNEKIIKAAAVTFFKTIPDSYNMVSAKDVKEKYVDNKDPNTVIIDIRAAKDYAIGHVDGAINIPFKELGDKIDTIDKGKKSIIYCYSGQSAGMALSLLRVSGYNNVWSMTSGMAGWDKENFPKVK